MFVENDPTGNSSATAKLARNQSFEQLQAILCAADGNFALYESQNARTTKGTDNEHSFLFHQTGAAHPPKKLGKLEPCKDSGDRWGWPSDGSIQYRVLKKYISN
jgi:hypothetical protein